jgi:hypothetical protein
MEGTRKGITSFCVLADADHPITHAGGCLRHLERTVSVSRTPLRLKRLQVDRLNLGIVDGDAWGKGRIGRGQSNWLAG